MKNILFFILLFTIGCSNNNNNNSTEPKPIILNINSLLNNERNLQKIEKITYIPLETNESCLIGQISKILYKNNRFYIFDENKTKALFIFTEIGKFLFKIDRIGRGPGEFVLPLDFDIDNEGNIYILDIGSQKIIKYSKTGEFLKEYKQDTRFDEFSLIKEDEIFFKNAYHNGECTIELGEYNLVNNNKKIIFPAKLPYDYLELPRFSFHYFFKSNNSILFNPRFRNTIYKLTNDTQITEYIKIESDKFPSNEFIMEMKKNPRFAFEGQNIIIDVRDIYESSNYISITIQDRSRRKFLISKITGNILQYEYFDNKRYLGDNIIHGIAEDEFISLLQINNFVKYDWNNTLQFLSIEDTVKMKLLSLTTFSNPVIVLLRFKGF